jgi:hypothetical protein
MIMKRFSLVIIMLAFVAYLAEAQEIWKQKRLEVFAGIGTTQFFGDIGGFSKGKNIIGLKDISLKQTRYNISGGVKYKVLRDLNVRFNIAYGKLNATDSRGSNEARGFSAVTTIIEPSLMAEYYFIKSDLGDSYLFNQGRTVGTAGLLDALEFYAFTGVGGLNYNAKLNALLTAQGMKHNGFTPIIPVGIGVNLLFTPDYTFGLELGGRYTFSDYLDGYSSQYSSSKDVYYFLNVCFVYKIRTNSSGMPLFLNKRRF